MPRPIAVLTTLLVQHLIDQAAEDISGVKEDTQAAS